MAQQLKPVALFADGVVERTRYQPIVSKHITNFFRRPLNRQTIFWGALIFR
jgi:hypothetical protein